jgi:hypothetical protein
MIGIGLGAVYTRLAASVTGRRGKVVGSSLGLQDSLIRQLWDFHVGNFLSFTDSISRYSFPARVGDADTLTLSDAIEVDLAIV